MLCPTLEKTHFLSVTQVFFKEKPYIYLVLGRKKALEFHVTRFPSFGTPLCPSVTFRTREERNHILGTLHCANDSNVYCNTPTLVHHRY